MSLTNAQEERLNLLQEEAAEVIQCCSKIKRFGYDSKHPRSLEGPTNLEHLETELGGFAAVLNLMVVAGDVDEDHCELAQLTKEGSMGKYTKYQEDNES